MLVKTTHFLWVACARMTAGCIDALDQRYLRSMCLHSFEWIIMGTHYVNHLEIIVAEPG